MKKNNFMVVWVAALLMGGLGILQSCGSSVGDGSSGATISVVPDVPAIP